MIVINFVLKIFGLFTNKYPRNYKEHEFFPAFTYRNASSIRSFVTRHPCIRSVCTLMTIFLQLFPESFFLIFEEGETISDFLENLHPDYRAYKKLAATGKQSSEIECPVIRITGFLRSTCYIYADDTADKRIR